MIQIAIVGIAAVLLALPFRYIKSEYAMYISLAGCIFIFYFIAQKTVQLLEILEQLAAYVSVDKEYLRLLFKIVGIAYITEFSGELCKDAGFGAIGNQIAIAGKLTILGMSVPVITAIFESISNLWTR